MKISRPKTLSLYFPLAIFLCLASAVLGISWFLSYNQAAAIRNEVNLIGQQTAGQLKNHVTDHLSIIEHLRNLWMRRQINSPEAFVETIESLQQQFSGFQAVNWVNPEGIIQWVAPEADNGPAKGANLAEHPFASLLLRRAAEANQDLATRPITLLQGGKGFATYYPLIRDGKLEGYLNGVFRIEPLLENALAQVMRSDYQITVMDGDQTVYARGTPTNNGAFTTEQRIELLDRTWTLFLTAGPASVAAQSMDADIVILVLGLILSVGLAYLLRLIALRQEALWAVEESYSGLFENATEGIYRSLPDGTCISCNPTIVKLNGFTKETELLSAINAKPTTWYVDRHRRSEFLQLLNRNDRVENFVSEVRRLGNGERFWISENAHVIRGEDGKMLGYQGTITDITERRRADETLRSEREFVVAMLDTADALICVIDMEGRVVRFNKACEKMSGYNLAEVEGRPIYDFVIPDHDREGLEGMLRSLRFGVYPNTHLNHWVCRSGEQRLIEWSNTALRDEAGKVAYCVAMGIDVTERKQAEEALQMAKEEAESANRAKSEFLANMSHELRTPLNAVIGFAEILENQMFGDMGDSRYGDYARDIRTSATHLLGIINNILDLSKVEAGRLELIEDPTDVKDVLGACLNIVKATANADEVAFEVKAAKDMPYLLADERMLRQVLLNILSNALKFTPAGGRITVTLTSDTSTPPQTSDIYRITIADTGIGMTAENIAKALTPFGQVESSLSRKYEGTGLGLPLSKSLVELHGGHLAIESRPGAGTEVILSFPNGRIIQRNASTGGAFANSA
ncbi:PAS domain S-box protein [Pelagibius sp. Alg239-R121]|uniref:PAS domain S-box protein n=1 Tax=Pelagibius sp. Alg239-R121 TaxID=2993448 RepID=UPI0024A7729B|nr:PAS domain S-box protein [Pelagibius sp. Alg239-R121]